MLFLRPDKIPNRTEHERGETHKTLKNRS